LGCFVLFWAIGLHQGYIAFVIGDSCIFPYGIACQVTATASGPLSVCVIELFPKYQ
jgi:hypothetical protein